MALTATVTLKAQEAGGWQWSAEEGLPSQELITCCKRKLDGYRKPGAASVSVPEKWAETAPPGGGAHSPRAPPRGGAGTWPSCPADWAHVSLGAGWIESRHSRLTSQPDTQHACPAGNGAQADDPSHLGGAGGGPEC